MSPIVVSSPGKVLLAGGYLVLDPAYPGVVVSTSSRFYTVIDHGNIPNTIQVVSPQFAQSTWVYNVSTEGDAVKVIPAASR
jgi:phosphomevalonate kinase